MSAARGFASYQPATVDPPVSRPATAHCSVTILREQPFKDYFPVDTRFEPPASCHGPWNKIVLDFDTRVQGVQYDRIGELWIGRDEILRFSTAEPTKAGIRYHIEKDVTAYAPLLRTPQRVTTLLGNLVNRRYTGIFYVTATLTFYETGTGAPAAQTADRILAIDGKRADQPDDETGHLSKTLTALPRNTAQTRWPRFLASDSRSSTRTPQPSPHPVPSAPSANGLHRPSEAIPPWRVNSANNPGVDITVTPPASASRHSPRRSACAAKCTATSDDEHAVSTDTAGPSRPST